MDLRPERAVLNGGECAQMAAKAIKSEWLTADTSDGPLGVYVSRPDDDAKHPAILVIQEIWGVNDHFQELTRRLAAEGYVAGAPELFHRFEPKILPYSEAQAGMALRNQLTDDMVTEDCNATIKLLNGLSQVQRGRVGIVGFCFGGRTTYLMATRSSEIKAAASFYGGGIARDDPSAPVNATANITAPIILFFGEQDQSIPMEQVERIRQELSKHGKQFEMHTYADAGHGFVSDRPANHNEVATQDAWQKTVAWFGKHLGA